MHTNAVFNWASITLPMQNMTRDVRYVLYQSVLATNKLVRIKMWVLFSAVWGGSTPGALLDLEFYWGTGPQLPTFFFYVCTI